jgi:acetolactate synthase-1/2/3 large subunit
VTGTVTAVANAFAAQVPLVVIGGARPLVQAEQGALQEFDQLSVFKPITKWAGVCAHTARIPELVALAFRHALARPCGPVYLELPMDVLFDEAAADREPGPARVAARAFGDPDAVERAAALLGQAERPAIVGGSGVWWDGAADALARLAERVRAPVFLNGSGRGSLPPYHPSFFQHARGAALAAADVVLVAGATLDFRLRYGRFGEGALVHVQRPRELGATACRRRHRRRLRRGARRARRRGRRRKRRRTACGPARGGGRWCAHRDQIDSEAAPIHHYRLRRELDRVLDPGTVVIGDGGDVVAAVSRVLRVHRPGHWLDPGPFGCLGAGPGYALGVGAAGFGDRIVIVMGDGAFGLNGLDFDSLVRFEIPAVLVIGTTRPGVRSGSRRSASTARRRRSPPVSHPAATSACATSSAGTPSTSSVPQTSPPRSSGRWPSASLRS